MSPERDRVPPGNRGAGSPRTSNSESYVGFMKFPNGCLRSPSASIHAAALKGTSSLTQPQQASQSADPTHTSLRCSAGDPSQQRTAAPPHFVSVHEPPAEAAEESKDETARTRAACITDRTPKYMINRESTLSRHII